MKKYLLFLKMFSILLILLLCGCTQEQKITNDDSDEVENDVNGEENSDDSQKFYGIWLEESENEGETMNMRHTFSEDGTYTFEILNFDHIDSGSWSVEDDKITTLTSHVNIYTFAFSNNYNTLTLIDITTKEQSILTKQ